MEHGTAVYFYTHLAITTIPTPMHNGNASIAQSQTRRPSLGLAPLPGRPLSSLARTTRSSPLLSRNSY